MVTPEGGRMRKKQMRHEHRLGAPQVSVGRHQRRAGGLRPSSQRQNEPGHSLLHHRQPPPEVEPQVKRHLLVSRASRVEPATNITHPFDELPLDKGVDILVGTRHKTWISSAPFENFAEPSGNGLCVFGGEDAGTG